MAKTKRKNYFFLIFLITYISTLILRVILTGLIGSKGVAFFSLPNELFFFFGFSISYAVEQSITVLVENRVLRQQYNNVQRVFKAGCIVGVGIGIVIAGLLLIFGNGICEGLFGMPLSYMAMLVMVPTIPLMILTGVIRGYLNGVGYRSISGWSYLLFAFSYLVAGFSLSGVFSDYGNKVSSLLRNEDFLYSYGAMGASLGILVSSAISFLFVLVFRLMYQNRARFDDNSYAKNQDTIGFYVVNVFLNGLFSFAVMGSFFLMTLLNEMVIFKSEQELVSVEYTFGEYYGKVFPLVYLTICFISLFMYSNIRKAISAAHREEYRNAREKLGRVIHRCVTFGSFFAAMIIVLGENIVNILFENSGEDTVLFIQIEGIAILIGVFAFVMIKLLLSMRLDNLCAIICGIGLVVHVVMLVILTGTFKLSVYGAIISNILFFVIVSVVGFLFVTKYFQYTQEWIRSFVVSILSALIVGVLSLLLNKAFVSWLGSIISLAIVFVLGAIAYIVLIILLHGYDEEELEGSAVGRLVISIGRLMHRM